MNMQITYSESTRGPGNFNALAAYAENKEIQPLSEICEGGISDNV